MFGFEALAVTLALALALSPLVALVQPLSHPALAPNQSRETASVGAQDGGGGGQTEGDETGKHRRARGGG